MRRSSLAAVLAVTVLASCGGRAVRTVEGRQESRITLEEIQRAGGQTALDMIRRLRPNWLSVSSVAASPIVVYLDGVRAGEADFLRQIRAANLQSAEHMNGSEAAARYGLNHSGGAILLVTRGR